MRGRPHCHVMTHHCHATCRHIPLPRSARKRKSLGKCGSGLLSERMAAKRRIRKMTVPLDPRGDRRDVGGQEGGRRTETGGDGRGRAGTANGNIRRHGTTVRRRARVGMPQGDGVCGTHLRGGHGGRARTG